MAKANRQILFDHEIFRRQDFGGISRYFAELMEGINKTPGYKAFPESIFSRNVYLRERKLDGIAGTFGNNDLFKKAYWKLENRQLYSKLKQGRFAVFHPTYYTPYFLHYLPQDKPFVLTVHDMIHENHLDSRNEYYGEETNGKMALIPKAAHIVAVSHYTKSQIIRHYPDISPDKISVVYHGANLKISVNADKSGLNLPEKYILFIGVKKHYKNFFWLAESLHDYLKSENIKMICAGGYDFDGFERRFLAQTGLEQHIVHQPFSTDQQLAALYKHAICFVYPSVEEGFGMPILEAFACGCPVVLSNSSCFPEIARDAALYFEPGDQQKLLSNIEAVRADSVTRSELIEKGLLRLADFSWERSAAEHIKIYDNLIE